MMILFAKWYVDLTGDEAFIRDRYAAFADVLDSYRERYARADGLLGHQDKWCVVEWPKNFQDDYDADIREGGVRDDVHVAINAWYIGAVKCMNSLAGRFGMRPYADIRPLMASFQKVFWDPSRSLFVDRDGSTHVSLPGNVYSTFFGLAPESSAQVARQAFLKLVREKGYSSISLFQYFPLFCYLRKTGHPYLESTKQSRKFLHIQVLTCSGLSGYSTLQPPNT